MDAIGRIFYFILYLYLVYAIAHLLRSDFVTDKLPFIYLIIPPKVELSNIIGILKVQRCNNLN